MSIKMSPISYASCFHLEQFEIMFIDTDGMPKKMKNFQSIHEDLHYQKKIHEDLLQCSSRSQNEIAYDIEGEKNVNFVLHYLKKTVRII